ncbi:histidine phosphatase superfamily [Fusarium solani]|uniref:Histidine phosphatase superfamily n=1 Tax=Fusarium solani TaxID=169388 RepID=A0A9P9L045_FUSSL|nr:histidine phosphatase superfamily [Fusarium solani]KAH7271564.1 histidine phosphatase superfamily [Fusarium solani]
MAPTIHLVRHAQGFHNLSIENEQLPDPDLTPLGEEQCAALRAAFPHHDKLTKLLASPMRRTVYTCLHAFGTDALLPITALPVFQEVSAQPCDIGSPVAKVRTEFEGKADYAGVEETWCEKGPSSKYEPTLEKLTVRGREARRTLREIAGSGDEHIVVVSHGGFLHFLTDDWHGVPDGRATGWSNCEFRSYQFVDPTGEDEDAALRETEESWQRREGNTIPPTQTEQRELRPIVLEKIAPHLNLSMPNGKL